LNLGGYTHNEMIKRGSADFVSAVANNPKRALEHMGIAVRQIPLDSFPSGQRFSRRRSMRTSSLRLPGESRTGTRTRREVYDPRDETEGGKQSGDVFKSRFVMVTRMPAGFLKLETITMEATKPCER
jgi:hypothetical protein